MILGFHSTGTFLYYKIELHRVVLFNFFLCLLDYEGVLSKGLGKCLVSKGWD